MIFKLNMFNHNLLFITKVTFAGVCIHYLCCNTCLHVTELTCTEPVNKVLQFYHLKCKVIFFMVLIQIKEWIECLPVSEIWELYSLVSVLWCCQHLAVT